MSKTDWSKKETKIARLAFEAAYFRECMAAREVARKTAAEIIDSLGLWRPSDRPTETRGVFEKRDRRRSVHPLIFARLIREGWIGREDLGLSGEKRDRVWKVAGVRGLLLKMRPKG
jgi:hypothetical protein